MKKVIANAFSDASQLERVSRVCRGWRRGFASGVTAVEVTVHRDPEAWRARMAGLSRLLPGLQRCKAHVGAGVESVQGAVMAMAESLDRMEVRASRGVGGEGVKALYRRQALVPHPHPL